MLLTPLLLAASLGFAISLTAQGTGSSAPLSQKEVDGVVQQIESAYVSAYNAGDAKAVASLYTKSASVLGEYGALVTGSDRLQNTLTAAFAQSARPKIEDKPSHSSAISADVIVTQGVSHVTPADPTRQPVDTLYTRVLVREGDNWRIAATQFAQPNPWTLTFPVTPVGEAGAKSVTLNNIANRNLTVRDIKIIGKDAADFTEKDTCNSTIPPAGTCSITVTFKPTNKYRRVAELSFWDDANTGRHAVRLSGTGAETSASTSGAR